ncbi:MAG: exo-alpha-sialidase [Actinomycetota bacterium]|nr:exo-alpha-sialidase [Actinomycetota bacterium]
MRIAVRTIVALALSSALTATLLAPTPVSNAAANKGGLHFSKPVALDSFAPLRSVVGTVYSEQNGQDPPSHEWAGEPSIEVDSKGTIFISGVCCVVSASPVWYSTDGGKTFKEMESPGHVREYGVGAEGDIAYDDSGHVWFIDSIYPPSLVETQWSDHGATWDRTTHTHGVVPALNDRPWTAWTKKGIYLYVNYGYWVMVYKSTDDGLTWTSPGPMEWKGSFDTHPYWPGHIAANRKTGEVWIVGNNSVGGPDQELISGVSEDGQSFKEIPVTRPERKGGFTGQFVGSSAIDDAGNVYTTWGAYDTRGCSVYYGYYSVQDKQWHQNKVPTGPGCATFPWIKAGADGKVALVWYQTDYDDEISSVNTNNQYQDAVPDTAEWYVHVAAISNARSADPSYTMGEVPTSGPILVGPLTRELWDFFQVAIDPQGHIDIAFAKKFSDGKPDSGPQTWFVKTTSGPRLR